jgi:hypothetical protein
VGPSQSCSQLQALFFSQYLFDDAISSHSPSSVMAIRVISLDEVQVILSPCARIDLLIEWAFVSG